MEIDKIDIDGHLAIELAPDSKVTQHTHSKTRIRLIEFVLDSKIHHTISRTRGHRFGMI